MTTARKMFLAACVGVIAGVLVCVVALPTPPIRVQLMLDVDPGTLARWLQASAARSPEATSDAVSAEKENTRDTALPPASPCVANVPPVEGVRDYDGNGCIAKIDRYLLSAEPFASSEDPVVVGNIAQRRLDAMFRTTGLIVPVSIMEWYDVYTDRLQKLSAAASELRVQQVQIKNNDFDHYSVEGFLDGLGAATFGERGAAGAFVQQCEYRSNLKIGEQKMLYEVRYWIRLVSESEKEWKKIVQHDNQP